MAIGLLRQTEKPNGCAGFARPPRDSNNESLELAAGLVFLAVFDTRSRDDQKWELKPVASLKPLPRFKLNIG